MFPSAVMLPREPGGVGQDLGYNGKIYSIPPKMTVTLRSAAIHYSPTNLGLDCNEFRFERWRADRNHMDSGSASNKSPAATVEPLRGSFLAFSEGFRGCLGKKFALVEIVAVLAVLFKDHRVELVQEPGETIEKARDRARKSIRNSISIFSLSIQAPVKVKWLPRLVPTKKCLLTLIY